MAGKKRRGNGNDFAAQRLARQAQKPTIICAECEKRVPLWDDMEEYFASPETKQQVRELEEQSAIVLDNESKERSLVGDVISTVALAGQLCREFSVSDHGIDMEIEFKSDTGEATGQSVSATEVGRLPPEHTEARRRGNLHHQRCTPHPLLDGSGVSRAAGDSQSEGEVRWMEVRDYLKHASDNGKKPVRQIVFAGERFDVMSVRGWRDRALRQGVP